MSKNTMISLIMIWVALSCNIFNLFYRINSLNFDFLRIASLVVIVLLYRGRAVGKQMLIGWIILSIPVFLPDLIYPYNSSVLFVLIQISYAFAVLYSCLKSLANR